MGLQRKIERTQLKQQRKEHNKGISKRYRSDIKGLWSWIQKRKRGDK